MLRENALFLITLLAVLFYGNESYLLKDADVAVENDIIIDNTTDEYYEIWNLDEDGLKMGRNLKPVNTDPIPEFFDWRDRGMVSPIKDQRDCEACWAFSAVANIESHLKIQRNIEVKLSEQFLIDCDDGNKGCAPASVIKTFADIVTHFGGVLREDDYYEFNSRQNECRWNFKNPVPVPVIGFRRVKPNEDVMAKAVYLYGPLSAAINAKSMTKYFNKSYIDEPTDEDCPPTGTDHSVLIVGYNVFVNNRTGQKVPYWIIKNSWGTAFGDKGYYYLVRGRNACGIATDVSFAYVD